LATKALAYGIANRAGMVGLTRTIDPAGIVFLPCANSSSWTVDLPKLERVLGLSNLTACNAWTGASGLWSFLVIIAPD
jgi:hypothetical protein